MYERWHFWQQNHSESNNMTLQYIVLWSVMSSALLFFFFLYFFVQWCCGRRQLFFSSKILFCWNILLSENCRQKMQNLSMTAPIYGRKKLKFRAPIIFSVRNLQLVVGILSANCNFLSHLVLLTHETAVFVHVWMFIYLFNLTPPHLTQRSSIYLSHKPSCNPICPKFRCHGN